MTKRKTEPSIPTVTIEGDVCSHPRVPLGLWSLDRALGFRDQVGMVLRAVYELYGNPGSGKSTLARYMAGRVKSTGTVIVCDLEVAEDRDYLRTILESSGLSGKGRMINYMKKEKGEEKARTHEEMVQEAVDALLDPEVNAVVIDSIGMFMPVAEREGDFGEAFMGKRAKEVAQIVRKSLAWMAEAKEPKALIAVNHVLETLATPVKGHYTPGGVELKYAATARIMMWRKETMAHGAFQAELRVEKLRQGGAGKERSASVFFIPGVGVSRGMTALFDCFRAKLATREASVKLRGTKVARIGELLDAGMDGKEDVFQPFHEALARFGSQADEEEETDAETETDE